jgi:hypothetical protein
MTDPCPTGQRMKETRTRRLSISRKASSCISMHHGGKEAYPTDYSRQNISETHDPLCCVPLLNMRSSRDRVVCSSIPYSRWSRRPMWPFFVAEQRPVGFRYLRSKRHASFSALGIKYSTLDSMPLRTQKCPKVVDRKVRTYSCGKSLL